VVCGGGLKLASLTFALSLLYVPQNAVGLFDVRFLHTEQDNSRSFFDKKKRCCAFVIVRALCMNKLIPDLA
jgi:hypothetical protein